ncbi:MAG: hypothetical protein E7B59_12650 [Enterobacteriaceae bacterium]|nr:hypothetical protein [Enterobacteriaceae bacterium]
MKLLELLVQELPKRGGWPDGVKEIEQDSDGQLIEMDPASDYYADFGLPLCEGWGRASVTREQYEAAVNKPVWDGRGLPPVGVECESKQFPQINWTKFRVVAVENGHVFGFWNDTVSTGLDSKKWEFRPIRTEEELKRDEAIGAIAEVYENIPHSDAVAYALYDAIVAGNIPGVRIA